MGARAGVAAEKKKRKNGSTENEASSTDVRRVGAWTEVVVLRDPPLVQVYRVESYGRRFRRALVFASQAAWCLADIDPDGHPALSDSGERYLLSAARLGAAASSLVVSRNLSEAQGRQQFVPARHLRGLLPAALLAEYAFWQSGDGDLYGDAKARRQAPAHDDPLPPARERRRRRGRRGRTRGGHTQDPASARVRTRDLRERSRRRRRASSRWWTCCAPAMLAAPPSESAYDEKAGGKTPPRRADGVAEAATPAEIPGGLRRSGRRGGGSRTAWRGPPRRWTWTTLAPGRRLGALMAPRPPRWARWRSTASVTGKLGSGLVRLWDRPPGAPPAGHLLQPRRFEEQEISGNLDQAGVRRARRFVSLRAAVARAGRAALRAAARARAGGARRWLARAPARRRRARPALDRVVEVAEGGGDPKPEKKESKQKDLAVVAAEEAAAVGTKGFGADAVLDRWDHAWIAGRRARARRAGTTPYPVHSSRRAGGDQPRRGPVPVLLRFLARRCSTCANSRTCACVSRGRRPRRRGCGRRSPALRATRRRAASRRRWRLSVSALGIGPPSRAARLDASSPSSRRTSPHGATRRGGRLPRQRGARAVGLVLRGYP